MSGWSRCVHTARGDGVVATLCHHAPQPGERTSPGAALLEDGSFGILHTGAAAASRETAPPATVAARSGRVAAWDQRGSKDDDDGHRGEDDRRREQDPRGEDDDGRTPIDDGRINAADVGERRVRTTDGRRRWRLSVDAWGGR